VKVDRDVPSYSSIDHQERIIWKPATSQLRRPLDECLSDSTTTVQPTFYRDDGDSTNFDVDYERFYSVHVALPDLE